MQYNFYKEISNRWTFSFDFLIDFKRFCFQPIHICIDPKDDFLFAVGFIFVRCVIRVEKWDN
jgi:hypothetical protein